MLILYMKGGGKKMKQISNQNNLVKKCQAGSPGLMAGSVFSSWKDPKTNKEYLVEIKEISNWQNIEVKNIEQIINESPSN